MRQETVFSPGPEQIVENVATRIIRRLKNDFPAAFDAFVDERRQRCPPVLIPSGDKTEFLSSQPS